MGHISISFSFQWRKWRTLFNPSSSSSVCSSQQQVVCTDCGHLSMSLCTEILYHLPPLCLPGAEEVTVVYTQLGGKVTLQMLLSEGVTINRIYIYWFFDTVEGPPLAWRIPSGSLGYSKGEQCFHLLKITRFTNNLWCTNEDIPDNHLTGALEAEWATRLSMSDFSLIIGNIQEKDFGTFICKQTQFGKKDIITKYKLFKLTGEHNIYVLSCTIQPDMFSS